MGETPGRKINTKRSILVCRERGGGAEKKSIFGVGLAGKKEKKDGENPQKARGQDECK